MGETVSWAQRIITEYESGSTGCFILHGNIHDQFVLPEGFQPALGHLEEYLSNVLLTRFDVIITYDLGYGIRVTKGKEIFDKWYASDQPYPAKALSSIRLLGQFLLECREDADAPKVALIIKEAHLIVPAVPNALHFELNSLASLLRSWASDISMQSHGQVSFILADQINNIHPLVSHNPRMSEVEIPLPEVDELERALEFLQPSCSEALKYFSGEFKQPAKRLVGTTVSSLENLLKKRHYQKDPLKEEDLSELKKKLVEAECDGLIKFVEPNKTLAHYVGADQIVSWLRQDLQLWENGDFQALPMGYLFCGPVGTGKTYLAECLAGEAGIPVVTIQNFRDRWLGSTEANLEKIFSLLDALGRCIVFIDEADQALGRRTVNSSDSGVSSRIYSMIAQKMAETENRGKILWVLASSRPDLIEVDLKRPGRIDVKIPILPALTQEEGLLILKSHCVRRGLELSDHLFESLLGKIPELLTPGAAEALSVKAYRFTQVEHLSTYEALLKSLDDYRPPVPLEVIREQMLLAENEATEQQFLPRL